MIWSSVLNVVLCLDLQKELRFLRVLVEFICKGQHNLIITRIISTILEHKFYNPFFFFFHLRIHLVKDPTVFTIVGGSCTT